MDDRKYQMLVWSLQGEALDRPGMFRIKVILISLFAYLVLFALLVLLMFAAVTVFVTAGRNGHLLTTLFFASGLLAVIPLVLLTLRMFFSTLPPPEGRVVTEQEVPQLFRSISELRSRLNGPPIDHVLITNEFNAGIIQSPRFGLFGGHRNYLVLGLPLLYALSPEEMLAVTAHEYGHLAGSHGKLGAWIYRQRRTFGALHAHAHQRLGRSFVNGVFFSMIDRFAPHYNAYTFVLSRQNEYEADAVAGEITSPKAHVSALIRSSLLSSWLHENFWPKLSGQAAQHEVPPYMPYAAMRKLLAVTMDEWATSDRLRAAMKAESDVYDTHPCLRERIIAMEQQATLPTSPKTSAAETLLGKFELALAREFDEAWWSTEKMKWQSYHRNYARSMVRIEELEKNPVEMLNVMDAQELALLLLEFRSSDAAKPVLEDLLGRSGERYPKPVYYYGRLLLSEGDARGLDFLEEAMGLSPSMGNECAQTGYEWLCAKQNEGEAEIWLEKLRANFN